MGATIALAVFILLTPWSGRQPLGTDRKPAGGEVRIDNFSFSPTTLTVAAGTTVTWINNADMPYTVVSRDKIFASPALDTGKKFSYTFSKPGVYLYYCSIHPRMTAKVAVE